MFSLSLLPLLVLITFATAANAASAALGIDFGTEYIKAAVARPGSPIEIVLTKDSKRKEAASLAFKPSRAQANDQDAYPERLYGGDAIALSARYPGDVYPNLKALLGMSPSDPVVESHTNRFPALQIHNMPREDGSASVGFSSKNLGKPAPFMVEELLAMELQNIKANAETLVGKNNFVSDVVITYPPFYTAEEKRALELAADLAGFRLLGLISDGQAVGLNYATTRAFDSKKKDILPEYHVVYDVGAGSTTATVLKFHGKIIKGPGKKNTTVQEVQVLGYGYDRTLGGDALNDLIVNDMVEKFLETKKLKTAGISAKEVKVDGKTMARFWKDAEKARQVLSANQQAFASFEGLFMEDVTFRYKITRTEFEALAATHALRLATPLNSALAMADLKLADIESVILHGGLTRTPFVQAELERVVGSAKKIKTNINADEAAAFGAAFKAAGLSPSFRVKDIRTADISGSAYTMKWNADGKERSQKIFLETSQVGTEKQVPIKGADDMKIEFFQHIAGQDKSIPVSVVDATNVTKTVAELKNSYGCVANNITATFYIRLSGFDGLPEIVSGTVSCVAQRAKEGTVFDNVKGMLGFGGKKDSQKPLKDEQDILSETPLPVDDPTSSGSVVPEATSTSSSKSTSTPAEFKPSTVSIPLLLKSTTAGPGAPPHKALPLIKSRLTAFDKSDQNAYQRSEALNVLEAFTYKARDYLDDSTFATFSTDNVRKELASKLSETSDWLYGDGTDAKLQDFKDRLKSMKALVDPVLKRKDESSRREEAIDLLKNSLKNASGMMDMIKGSIAEAAKTAASTVSSAASSVVNSATAGDDLEEEPYSTSSSSPEETDVPLPKPYSYTEEDLSSIEKVYETAQKWLDERVKAQGKLSSSDEPAFLVADINAKARQVGAAVSDIVMKQIKMQQPPKIPKKPKSKKSKKQSSTSTGVDKTVEATVSATASVRDEL